MKNFIVGLLYAQQLGLISKQDVIIAIKNYINKIVSK